MVFFSQLRLCVLLAFESGLGVFVLRRVDIFFFPYQMKNVCSVFIAPILSYSSIFIVFVTTIVVPESKIY